MRIGTRFFQNYLFKQTIKQDSKKSLSVNKCTSASDKRAPVFIWGCWKLIRMLFWLTCCPPIHFDPNTFDKELTQQVIQGRPLEDSVSIIYITLKRSSYILICVMNEYISQNIFWLHIPNIANHLYICHPKQFSPFFNLHSSTLGQPDAFSYVVGVPNPLALPQASEAGNLSTWCLGQTSYLSQISQIISVEKNLSWVEISIFCKEF